jgi:hypothetical protein
MKGMEKIVVQKTTLFRERTIMFVWSGLLVESEVELSINSIKLHGFLNELFDWD